MQSIQSPIASVDLKPHRKAPFRKPLQPKNFNSSNTPSSHEKPKPIKISLPLPSVRDGREDKENRPIGGPFDVSLAEELVAIRLKMERLREEREKTERVLREKDLMLEEAMGEMENRWREQRMVEMEMERIRRLKDLKDSCTRIPPFISLRVKEREKKIKEAQLPQVEKENEEKEKLEDKRTEREGESNNIENLLHKKEMVVSNSLCQ